MPASKICVGPKGEACYKGPDSITGAKSLKGCWSSCTAKVLVAYKLPGTRGYLQRLCDMRRVEGDAQAATKYK